MTKKFRVLFMCLLLLSVISSYPPMNAEEQRTIRISEADLVEVYYYSFPTLLPMVFDDSFIQRHHHLHSEYRRDWIRRHRDLFNSYQQHTSVAVSDPAYKPFTAKILVHFSKDGEVFGSLAVGNARSYRHDGSYYALDEAVVQFVMALLPTSMSPLRETLVSLIGDVTEEDSYSGTRNPLID